MQNRTPIETAAVLVGATFLLAGILGFVPGVTTNLYDGLDLAGSSGDAKLLSVFEPAFCTTSSTCYSG